MTGTPVETCGDTVIGTVPRVFTRWTPNRKDHDARCKHSTTEKRTVAHRVRQRSLGRGPGFSRGGPLTATQQERRAGRFRGRECQATGPFPELIHHVGRLLNQDECCTEVQRQRSDRIQATDVEWRQGKRIVYSIQYGIAELGRLTARQHDESHRLSQKQKKAD